jgi:hypothetical protein
MKIEAVVFLDRWLMRPRALVTRRPKPAIDTSALDTQIQTRSCHRVLGHVPIRQENLLTIKKPSRDRRSQNRKSADRLLPCTVHFEPYGAMFVIVRKSCATVAAFISLATLNDELLRSALVTCLRKAVEMDARPPGEGSARARCLMPASARRSSGHDPGN